MGQILGVISRIMASVMAALPLQREGALSDQDMLQRFNQRPQTVSEALYLSQMDLLRGITSGLAGGGGGAGRRCTCRRWTCCAGSPAGWQVGGGRWNCAGRWGWGAGGVSLGSACVCGGGGKGGDVATAMEGEHGGG